MRAVVNGGRKNSIFSDSDNASLQQTGVATTAGI